MAEPGVDQGVSTRLGHDRDKARAQSWVDEEKDTLHLQVGTLVVFTDITVCRATLCLLRAYDIGPSLSTTQMVFGQQRRGWKRLHH